MPSSSVIDVLRASGVRDTQPRRLVIEALKSMKRPASPYEIADRIEKKRGGISVVTVYRILELLESMRLAHRHPCSGKLSLCEHPGAGGAHAHLHCGKCGSSEEFCSEEFATVTKKQAAKYGFKAASPLLEIVGLCRSCRS